VIEDGGVGNAIEGDRAAFLGACDKEVLGAAVVVQNCHDAARIAGRVLVGLSGMRVRERLSLSGPFRELRRGGGLWCRDGDGTKVGGKTKEGPRREGVLIRVPRGKRVSPLGSGADHGLGDGVDAILGGKGERIDGRVEHIGFEDVQLGCRCSCGRGIGRGKGARNWLRHADIGQLGRER
jgi:hypothetical protein